MWLAAVIVIVRFHYYNYCQQELSAKAFLAKCTSAFQSVGKIWPCSQDGHQASTCLIARIDVLFFVITLLDELVNCSIMILLQCGLWGFEHRIQSQQIDDYTNKRALAGDNGNIAVGDPTEGCPQNEVCGMTSDI